MGRWRWSYSSRIHFGCLASFRPTIAWADSRRLEKGENLATTRNALVCTADLPSGGPWYCRSGMGARASGCGPWHLDGFSLCVSRL